MSDNSYNVANTRDLFAMQKGFVEDVRDPKGSGRVKVRIINKEFRTGDGGQFIPVPATEDLPWAAVLMPVNASGGSATCASNHNIKSGDIVWCIFVNGDSRQRLVIGSQGAVANASSKKPGTEYGPLQRYISQDKNTGDSPNPALHVSSDQKEKNKNLGVKPVGAMGDDDQSRALEALNADYSPGGNKAGAFSVAVADGKCASNPATKMDTILAEFFGAVQSTSGNVGSYYISKYTGELFDIQRIAKGYISRIQNIVEALISRAFGELMAKLKEVIQKLVKALLAPLPGCLKQVVDWFTQALEKMGCSMGDIFGRVSDFVTSTLEGYVGSVVNWAACQTKRLTDGILGNILGEITGVIDDVFGSISSVLGAIGSVGDVVGGAISSVMSILGISCTGTAACSDGPPKKSSKSGAFSGLKGGYNDLDEILQNLQDGPQFPINGVCDAATVPAVPTTEVNVWGPQLYDDINDGNLDDINDIDDLNDDDDSKKRKRKNRRKENGGEPDGPNGDGDNNGNRRRRRKGKDDPDDPGGRARKRYLQKRKARCAQRFFRVGDARGTKGQKIPVQLRRNGDLTGGSAISYYTVDGTAKAGEDYCPASGYLGFGEGQSESTIEITTLNTTQTSSAFAEVEVDIEFFVDDDPARSDVALDGFSIGDKTFRRKNTKEPHTQTKTVKLLAPVRNTNKDGKEQKRYRINYINLNPEYNTLNKKLKVNSRKKKITLDDNISNGIDVNATISIKAVRGGTAFFSSGGNAGRFIDVQARPKKEPKGPPKGIQVNNTVTEQADEEGCKYFYVKMKMNDGCGKIRKKTGVVIMCPPTTQPPPVNPPTVVPVDPPPLTPAVLQLDVPYYNLTADRSSVFEGEIVTFTLDTANVEEGSTVNYTVGRAETGITLNDISWIEQDGVKRKVTTDADLAGTFTVGEDGSDSIRIKLREDNIVENDSEVSEQVIVQLNGLSVAAGCLVLDPLDFDNDLTPGTATVDIIPEREEIKSCESMDITIETTNIEDGTNIPYTIFGTQLNEEDIVQDTEGTILIQNGIGVFTLSVDCNRIAETTTPGTITFAIPDFGSTATIILTPNDGADDTTDPGGGDDTGGGGRCTVDADCPEGYVCKDGRCVKIEDTLFPDDNISDDDLNDRDGFNNNGNGDVIFDTPIIDDDGGIIDIPVLDSGNRFLAPPFMSVESNTGFGAYIEPIINSDGYLTRVRVRRGGQGYTGQRKPDNVVCDLVGIVITNVGGLYDTAPTVYVDGDSTIAKATISPEGFVNNIILMKPLQCANTPDVVVTGGGGFGCKCRADLQCIPEDQSQLILQSLARDPANYVDCP